MKYRRTDYTDVVIIVNPTSVGYIVNFLNDFLSANKHYNLNVLYYSISFTVVTYEEVV